MLPFHDNLDSASKSIRIYLSSRLTLTLYRAAKDSRPFGEDFGNLKKQIKLNFSSLNTSPSPLHPVSQRKAEIGSSLRFHRIKVEERCIFVNYGIHAIDIPVDENVMPKSKAICRGTHWGTV